LLCGWWVTWGTHVCLFCPRCFFSSKSYLVTAFAREGVSRKWGDELSVRAMGWCHKTQLV
jgi:hypothetical protein